MDTAYIYLLSAAEEGGMCTEVRRAMNLAIDRDEIIDKILGGEGRPLSSTFSPVRTQILTTSSTNPHQCVLTRCTWVVGHSPVNDPHLILTTPQLIHT